MQVSNIHRTTTYRLNAPPRSAAKSTPDVDQAAVSGNSLDGLLESLKEAGLETPKRESERIAGSLEAGYESLVPFRRGNDKVVASLRTADELADFTALVLKQGASAELNDLNTATSTLEQQGGRIYFQREGTDLPTNAAGAALLLHRGETVSLVKADGEVVTASNLDEARQLGATPPDSSSESVILGQLLDRAASLKIGVAPYDASADEESPTKASNIAKNLKSMFGGKGASLESKAEYIKTLSEGGKLTVALPDDERKLPLPVVLGRDQLQALVTWSEAPTPEMTAFKDAYEKLQKNDVVLMAREQSGTNKGMLANSDARASYLNLVGGGEVVALLADGNLLSLKQPSDVVALETTGKVPGPPPTRYDGEKNPSDNLFMVYHVTPFDPIEKGNYEDLPLRLTEVGSSPHVDVVAMRSDLPNKRNLRVDRIQKGELQNLKTIDPKTAMSDPKVLEDFLFDTIMANQSDKHLRLLVGGHGGAEKGLLPDGEHNNAAADNAMQVDDFAGAIKKSLDRVEEATGKRPRISNLILGSCLMGNTSFIHALAKTGDIDVLCASPEVMMGSDPVGVIDYLNTPETADASPQDFAKYLVDMMSEAPAMPGGSKALHHADTYGAYDLSPAKAERFQKALNGFFGACLAEPETARFIKEDIAHCPTYGVNPIINVMFDVDDRDLIQVVERIKGDARINSKAIKEACDELLAATSEQVMLQKVSENYEGRKGPTIYMPVDGFDYDEKMGKTDLLANTDYKKFLDMIFEQPLQRTLGGSILTEINRFTEMMRTDKAEETKAEKTEETEEKKGLQDRLRDLLGGKDDSGWENSVHSLEDPVNVSGVRKVSKKIKALIRGTAGVAGAVAVGLVAAVPAAVVGLVLGARAGFTGTSLSGSSHVGGEKPRVLQTLGQAILAPAEESGIVKHQEVGYAKGQLSARFQGALVGAAKGAVRSALAGAAVGGLVGGLIAYGIAGIPTAILPGDPSKHHPPEGPDLAEIMEAVGKAQAEQSEAAGQADEPKQP
ncbi:MAG: hypothetical protein AB7S38_37970 [Vulcanimicrobiota bacterium]